MVFDEKFWLCISFFLFVYFTYKPIKKAILSTLDDKILQITSKLRESHKIRQDAESLLEDVQKNLEQLIIQRQQQEHNNKLSIEQLEKKGEEKIHILVTARQKQLSDLVKQYQNQATTALKNDITKTTAQLVEQYCHEIDKNIDKHEHIQGRKEYLELDDVKIAKNLMSSYKITDN